VTNIVTDAIGVELIMPFVAGGLTARPLEDERADERGDPLDTADLYRERSVHRGSSAFQGMSSDISYTALGRKCRLLRGRYGVAALCVSGEISGIGGLAALERDVTAEFHALLGACPTEQKVDSGVNQPLWTHRLIISEGEPPPIVPLQYGRSLDLANGARVVVGEGFSALVNPSPDHRDAVVDALFLATQAWVIHDDIWNRSEQLMAAGGAGDRDDTNRLERLTSEIGTDARRLAMFVRHQRQGLLDGRGRVYDMALDMWRLDAELPVLIDRADAYLQQLSLQLAQLRSRSDHRRNLLLFGLGFTSLTQTGATLFELTTGTDVGLGPAPRPLLALALGGPMAVAVVISVAWVISGWLKDRRRVGLSNG